MRAFPEAEIVIVDNASRDATAAAVATTAGVRLIELPENVGFARACNVGAEAAAGPYILFMNPDAQVLEVRGEFRRLLERRPFGLVAPAFDDEPERRRPDSHWSREIAAHVLGMLRPREWRPPRVRRARDGEPAWVSAAMLLVVRDEFLRLGGFDPRFFLYYEDRDLSRRYRGTGLPVVTTNALRGTHHGGTSSGGDELRVAPIGWGVLGWIQYVAIYNGLPAAARCARATLVALAATQKALRLPAAAGWGRARRKVRQLDELRRFLAERASSNDRRFCPDALHAVRRHMGAPLPDREGGRRS